LTLQNASRFAGRAVERLRRSWAKQAFDRVADGILDSTPLPLRGESPVFVSLLCHRDLACYLLAIKSLYSGIGHGRVAVINDGSLTPDDLAVLRRHIAEIEVFEMAAIDTAGCPRGGCWERLVKIVELSNTDYVIQVDADTLVAAPIPEVCECWENNRSFLLGTGSGRAVAPAADAARMVQGWIKTYGWTEYPVGVEAEASLDRLPDAGRPFYVHASAGFAGFARGAFALDKLVDFSACMSGLLGARRWNEWGSEQIASNYLLANAPDATVLPFPRYACFEPHLALGDHAFLHFLGAYRYNGGVYRRHAAEFISRYNATPRPN
jgi:hypothetical protein